ncbi:plasma protease C1 inhibitor isoform X2 [Myripristis murdjan]|uniref:plasma protease C1 inhibitor isoform X2 n=1 Tax=Myripristis murdjan TaxID=586833 RepID=UPI001175E45C|nr:plasma protease C1 inhibitor isoform X2 [Myripristis murdjan]
MRRLALFCLSLQLMFELSSPYELRVVPDSSLILPCRHGQSDLNGVLVTWTYNGGNISAKTPVNPSDGALSIPFVTVDSEGEYLCVVQEDKIMWRTVYNIKVDASSVYMIELVEGSSVYLPCRRPLSSQDKVYPNWFKVAENDKRTQLYPVEYSNREERLEWGSPDESHSDQPINLIRAVVKDTGTYHCESAKGERFSTIHLVVKASPQRPPFSCDNFTTAWEPCLDKTSRSWAPILEESQAEFSMKLYSHLSRSKTSENLLFSPISISGVLSHLLLGARGDTRRHIETAVCLPHDFHCVHFQMKRLKEKLAGSMQIASQIYYNPHMNLSETFTNDSVEFYEAEPVGLLPTNAENIEMINSWVANKTNNKITHLVDDVPPDTRLILLNAVSFSGQWKLKFDNKAEKQLFTKLNGELVKVPILKSSKYSLAVDYVAAVKAQVGRFPLTDENSLYILLPRSHQQSDMQTMEEKMTDSAVRQMIEHMKVVSPEVMEVILPKIKLDIKTDMKGLLRKLGLSSLFEEPNLCGIYSEDRLALNDAQHKAFLTLTEEGVEGGAVTSLSYSRSFPTFSALRPFMLLLWNDRANVPLFIGRVTDP